MQHRVGCHPWTPNGQCRLRLLQTYQRPGDRGDMAGSSAFRPCVGRQTCTCVNRQHGCKGCDKSPRRFTLDIRDVMSLTAGHIPGKVDVAADTLSGGGPYDDERSLNPIIVGMIGERFGRAQVDLFARRCIRKCPLWFFQNPTELAPLGTNAFGPDPRPRNRFTRFLPLSCCSTL